MFYIYKAELDRVIDGDTMDFIIDLGFHIKKTVRIRVKDFDAPEVRGADKEEGIRYSIMATSILKNAKTIMIKTGKDRSFDRWVGDIVVDGIDFVRLMNEN